MNNTSTRTEILEALENVDSVTMESSLDVMFTMADSYDKAAVILENYNGSDLSAFAIFQEDGEGENKTAVQQGDASGNVNAEAKKKQNIFVKIWTFIKNIFKSFGQWVKKCWNGFTFAEVQQGSGALNNFIDTSAGKDNATLVDFAKKNFGIDISWLLTAGGFAIALGSIVSGMSMEQPLTALAGALVGAGLITGGVKLWMKIRSKDVETNIKSVAINWLMKVIVGLLLGLIKGLGDAGSDGVKRKAAKKSFLKDFEEKIKSNAPELEGGIATPDDKPETISHMDAIKSINEMITEAKKVSEADVEKLVADEDKITENEEELAEDKDVAKKVSAIGKIFIFFQQAWRKFADFINKINIFKKKAEESGFTDEESSTETPENPETLDDNDVDTSAATGADAEPKPEDAVADQKPAQDTEAQTEGTATEPELNGKYDEKQVEGWVTNINDEKGNRKTIIPYNGHRFQWNKFAGKYVYVESVEDDIDVDDSVVSEAATWYNRF